MAGRVLTGVIMAGCLQLLACAAPAHSPAVAAPAAEAKASHPDTTTRRARRGELRPPFQVAAAQRTHNSDVVHYREPLAAAEDTRGVVLLYHAFDRGRQPLSLPSSRFAQHLDWLRDNHVEIVPLSHFIDFLRGDRLLPKRVAVITIDDGMLSVYQKAWPLLRRRRVPFTLGIPTALLHKPKRGQTMSWAAVREMMQSGLCEIASHGHRHRRLPGLPDELAASELTGSMRLIMKHTQVRPIAYFYPLGAVDKEAGERTEEAGYVAAFTASGAPIGLGSADLRRVPRTTIFYEDTVGRLSWHFRPKRLAQIQPRFRR